jgi:hypothetical protein
MAKKQKSTTAPADNGLKNVSDYRFPEATRKNNPPAKIAAEGFVPLIPKAEYLYSPRRPPELRFDPTGRADELPELLARAMKQKLTAAEASVLAEALRVSEPWESSAGFRLESSDAVQFYARNDHRGLTIPYEYMGIDHAYEPDFLVRLSNGMTVVLEIKGFEDDRTKAKHTAANRWVEAANNWGQLRRWAFHVCRNPQLLDKEMEYLARAESGLSDTDRTVRRES